MPTSRLLMRLAANAFCTLILSANVDVAIELIWERLNQTAVVRAEWWPMGCARGDVGIEEPGSSVASFLVPGGLIKRPEDVVTEIRIPCISEELKPRSRHRKGAELL